VQVKHLAAYCAFILTCTAQAGGGLGALGGLGDAMQRQAEMDSEAEAQKQLILQRHELEMERMRRDYEMQRQAQERSAQQQAARRAAEDAAADRRVDAAHPGWRTMVKTRAFREWTQAQPASVQRLGASQRPEDAILMLDLYKRDRPNWQAFR
jgi:hypothetical protein